MLAIAALGCGTPMAPDASPSTGGTPSDGGAPDAGHSDAGSGDAGHPATGHDAGVDCTATPPEFPAFSKTCSSVSECTVGLHQTDCCGTLDAIGIATSAAAAFSSAEAACVSMYPGCGCASGKITTDNGQSAPAGSGGSAIILACVSGKCETSVRAAAACDGATCSATEVCLTECAATTGHDAGHPPSKCVAVPSACAGSTSCACYGSTDPCGAVECTGVDNGLPQCRCH